MPLGALAGVARGCGRVGVLLAQAFSGAPATNGALPHRGSTAHGSTHHTEEHGQPPAPCSLTFLAHQRAVEALLCWGNLGTQPQINKETTHHSHPCAFPGVKTTALSLKAAWNCHRVLSTLKQNKHNPLWSC